MDKTVLFKLLLRICLFGDSLQYSLVEQSKNVSRVFVLQKRILRLIFNMPQQSSCREYFKAHKIFTIRIE